MPETTFDQNQLKEILKAAIVELLQENRKELYDLLAEIMEDIAMERAIAEGQSTEKTSRDSIFKLLEA